MDSKQKELSFGPIRPGKLLLFSSLTFGFPTIRAVEVFLKTLVFGTLTLQAGRRRFHEKNRFSDMLAAEKLPLP